MQPYREHLAIPIGRQWAIFDRRLPQIPFQWHYHPEYELTLTLNSRGQRFVGDSIESYEDGDLVLLGSNLPHTWCSDELSKAGADHHRAVVIWFSEAFIRGVIEPLTEFSEIRRLLNEASRGVRLTGSDPAKVYELYTEILKSPPTEGLIALLRLLNILSKESSRTRLSSAALGGHINSSNADKGIERAIQYLHDHYSEDCSIARLTKIAALSRSTLLDLFKKQTQLTVGEYLTGLRMGHACALLVHSDESLASIAQEVGYTNVTRFSQRFKAIKKMAPSEFRASYMLRLNRR
jgi:AraC-like DNA-binding protein